MGYAAYEIPSFYVGVLEANVNMSTQSTWQYTGVDVGAATGAGLVGPGALIAPASSGAAVIGVLQNNPQLAEVGAVMVHGVSKMVAGDTITIGQILTVNSTGQAVPALSGNYGMAKALQAGASGNTITVLLYGYGKQ